MCSAASPEVNVTDVQVTKSARNESRRSIGNDSDLGPLYIDPATTTTTATVTVTTTADNSHSDSDSRSTSRMNSGHRQSIGSGSGSGGANHNSDTPSTGASSPFSTLSPIRQHHSRHSRRASDLAADTGTNCFPNPAHTSSILSLQPQQTATSLDTDAPCMADKDGCRRTHHHTFSLAARAAADENSAPFTLPLSRPSSPPPLLCSPPPLPDAPSPRHRSRYLQAKCTSPQLNSSRHLENLPAISLAPVARASSHFHSTVDNSSRGHSPLYRVHPAAFEPPLLATTMACVTSSVAAPAASIVAPSSSTRAVGSIFAANLACNPSLSAPLSASLHSPSAAPLASAQSISQLYSTSFSLPPGTTTATTTVSTLSRPPPSLQLFVAHTAEGAIADPGSGHIGQDIDIDIDMEGDMYAGSGQDSDVGSDDHARPSASQATAGIVTASGSRQPPLHGHSLSESQISPIRSLTALALSPTRSPLRTPRVGRSSAAATQQLGPMLDATAQRELLHRVEVIQRYCDDLRQVQAQQESKIRSLEATVRRFSDVTSPLSSHQFTPAATSSAAAQLVSAAASPPFPPSASIDERISSHYQHHHQRAMMPPAFAPLTAASASGLQPIPHLPPIQAPMPLLSSTSIHRASDADNVSEGAQYSHPPQPVVAYQQSHSASAAVASEHRATAQMSAVMEQQQQQHGSLPQPPLAAPQHSHHHAYSQQTLGHASPSSFAPRFSAPTHGHQQPQVYRQAQNTSYGGGGDQFSPKMARQASPLPPAAVGGSQAHSQHHHHHHHHRSLGTGSRSQLQQHSYQRSSGSASRSRRGSAVLPIPLESDRGVMPVPYVVSSGHGDDRDTRLLHHYQQQQHLQAAQHPQPPRQFQAAPLISSSSSSRRASAGPSAFGYPAIAASTASAVPTPLGSATAADLGPHFAGAEGGQASLLPAIASGHPSMRMKRPRDAESGDEFAGADVHASGASGDASGDATLSHTPSRAYSMHHQHSQQQPPPHLHHHHHTQSRHSQHPSHHAALPPIRIGGGGGGGGDGSQQMAPSGSARAAATNFGSGVGSSLHLVQPSALPYAHSGNVAFKGKGVASDYGGAMEGPAFSGGEQPARVNRDAQPTHTWLATQRQYKTALLHLLSLESFYPSDMAMLNMFRSMGDFTADQVEIHGATLLSWARGWLRYSRNAVLRSTLDNKSKEPIKNLAEALQHDLHSDEDFTTPSNLRRCTLLRLIYFQWQAVNKLGTKSQSMYRDYESRLREIEALPTAEEQERDWKMITTEEQQRRLEMIRESRQRSDSIVQPRIRVRPEQMFQSRIQMNVAPPQPPPSAPPQMSISAPVSASAGQSELAHGTSAMQQLSLSRRQSGDWLPSYPPSAQSPTPGPSHYHYPTQQQQQQQHYQGLPLPPPSHLHYRQHYQPAQPAPPPPPPVQYPRNPGYSSFPQQQQQQQQLRYRPREADVDMQVESMDNDSEMSVNLSPEPQ